MNLIVTCNHIAVAGSSCLCGLIRRNEAKAVVLTDNQIDALARSLVHARISDEAAFDWERDAPELCEDQTTLVHDRMVELVGGLFDGDDTIVKAVA